jgi:hypothetical protein
MTLLRDGFAVVCQRVRMFSRNERPSPGRGTPEQKTASTYLEVRENFLAKNTGSGNARTH